MGIDLNTVANTYLRHHSTKSDEDFWAWEEVDRMVRSGDLDVAWQITLLLLTKSETDETLGYVAAGPLEDLVDCHGIRALERLERACDKDSRLQFALSGIWLSPDSPVLQRWQALMVKYGFANGKRKPLSRHPDCWPNSWPLAAGE